MKKCFCLLFILLSINSFSQRELTNDPFNIPTNKPASWYLKMAKDSMLSKPTKSNALLLMAIEKGKYENLDEIWIEATLLVSEYQINQSGEFDIADENLNQVFSWLNQNQNQRLKAEAHLTMAAFLQLKKQESENALNHTKEALKLFERLNLHKNIVECYCQIGFIYRDQLDFNTAKDYYQKGISIAEDNQLQANAHNCYAGLTGTLGRLGQFHEAKILQEKNIQLCEENNNLVSLGSAYSDLGITYAIMGDFEMAKKQMEHALQITIEIGDLQILGKKYADLGNLCMDLGQKKEALDFFDQAILWADSTEQLWQQELAYRGKSRAFYNTEQFQKAYDYYEYSVMLSDTLFDRKQRQRIADLQIQYHSKEKDQELSLKDAQLQRQKIFNWAIGITGLFLLSLAFFTYRLAQQRKQTNTQLKQLDRAKSRFFANISHELRTPLTLILAPLENAFLSIKSKTAKKELQLVKSNSKKLQNLVDEILDLSKLESGKMILNEKAVALEPLLRRIFFSYHSLANLRGFILSFSYHLSKDLVVMLDIDKFEKVINNLLSNAFKFSQRGGTITLRAFEEKDFLQIEVQDTGKGIPKQQLDKIFDRFYQVEDEYEPLQGGTGIGLAYAREIATLFKGNILVKSTLGKGSSFTFSIPFKKTKSKNFILDSKQAINPSLEDSKPKSFVQKNGKSKILIVEDNPEMNKFLFDTLSPYYNCSTATDGEEALNILEKTSFDLITSDIMMPNMDGFTLLNKLKDLHNLKNTAFILLTARAMEEDKLEGFRLGVDDYLTKPFSTKELLARIDNLIQNKNKREAFQLEEIQIDIKEEDLSFEAQLLKKAENHVLENISNSNYKVTDLANSLHYSRRQLVRILKNSTGFTPVEFIREIRLQKAYRMLESRQYATIAEVHYEVGIEDASYFSKKFQERFGKKPSEI